MPQRLLFLLVVLAGCGTPPGKTPNAATNSSTNNVNSATNSATNSQNSGNIKPGPTVVDPTTFDQDCTFDEDCSLVYGGDVCGCRSVCADAIATASVPDFEAAVQAIDCSGSSGRPECLTVACEEQMPVCASGTCDAMIVTSVDATQFDRSCAVDTDCVLVSTGTLCTGCNCSVVGINVDALPDYQAAVGDVDCNPGAICNCAAPDQAWCNEGNCDGRFSG